MKPTFLVAPALVMALVLFNNPSQAQQKNDDRKTQTRSSLNVNSVRSDGAEDTEINYTEDGHRYRIRLNGQKIVEMSIDEKKVAEADFAKYEPAVKKILEQIEQDRKQAELDRQQAEKDRQQAMKDREQAEKDRQQADRDREQANKDRERAESHREQARKDREQADRDRAQAERDREQAKKDRAQAEIDRKKAEEDRKLIESLFDELVTDKLVTDRESLTSLELDETKLVINGKEQPQNVHSRYKEKYLKGTNARIRYGNVSSSRTLTVN